MNMFSENREIERIVGRYEDMKSKKTQYYFDVEEFEDIIDFYVRKDNFRRAFEVSKYANNQHPQSTVLQLKKAQMLIDTSHFPEAFNILNFLERLEPENHEVLISKGIALGLQGKIKSAEKNLYLALDKGADSDEIYRQIAFVYEQNEQFEIAVKFLSKAFKLNPKNTGILYDLGYCTEKAGFYNKSLRFYKRYLEEEPFSAIAWYNLGVIHSNKDEYQEAIEAYDYAIAIDPEYASPYFNKANSYLNLDEFENAIEIYQEYLLIEPNSEEAVTCIGECYEQLENFDEAIDYYRRATDLNDNYGEAWFGLASACFEKESWGESLQYINKALSISNSRSDFWFVLANTEAKLQNFENARFAYRQTVRIDPFDYEAWLNYSAIYAQENKIADALSVLEEAYKSYPTSPDILYRLSGLLFICDCNENAIYYLEQALKQDATKSYQFLEIYEQGENDKEVLNLIKKYLIDLPLAEEQE